jgi:hypothetical protein
METTLERPAETSFILYEIRVLQADEPAVKMLRGKFFENYGLKIDTPNPNLVWFGIFNKVMCLVVFALGVRAGDGGVEVTDFYAIPTKDGAKAVAWALTTARQMIDAGIANFMYTWVLGRNKSMQRKLEKAFGVAGPRSVLYTYGNV